jgi:8-oxo-dGTP diphosphatase
MSGRLSIRVVAGALFNSCGDVLVAERPAAAHLAGAWEFPGGKVCVDETDAAALQRELREELGIEVIASEELACVRHEYPERCVELHLHRVLDWAGEPRGLDGQALRWVALEALHEVGILEADRPFIAALQRRGAPKRAVLHGTAVE